MQVQKKFLTNSINVLRSSTTILFVIKVNAENVSALQHTNANTLREGLQTVNKKKYQLGLAKLLFSLYTVRIIYP